jgi:hypothetical protein
MFNSVSQCRIERRETGIADRNLLVLFTGGNYVSSFAAPALSPRSSGLMTVSAWRSFRAAAYWLALIVVFSVSAPAQTSFGTIVGNVTDESGATISQVAVTITNEGTSAARTVVTGEGGSFTVPSLPSGTYTVQAEMKGFRTEIERGLKLDVNQTRRVDLTLRSGTSQNGWK